MDLPDKWIVLRTKNRKKRGGISSFTYAEVGHFVGIDIEAVLSFPLANLGSLCLSQHPLSFALSLGNWWDTPPSTPNDVTGYGTPVNAAAFATMLIWPWVTHHLSERHSHFLLPTPPWPACLLMSHNEQ